MAWLTSRLERGTTDQETVNVLLFGQVLAVLLVDAATVQDASLFRHLVADLLLEPVADAGVNLLCLLGRGDLAGANSPDGLVGNDNLGPEVRGAELALEGLELLGNDLESPVALALLERLATAPDNTDAVLCRILGLGGNEVVALAQNGPSLAVAENDPRDAAVAELSYADLAGEGAVGFVEDVLRGHADSLVQVLTDKEEVQRRGSDDSLCRKLSVNKGLTTHGH
jgi:hypothetical protein